MGRGEEGDKSQARAVRRAHRAHPIAVPQIECSLLSNGSEAGILIPVLRELGTAAAYGVLGRGLLMGSIRPGRAAVPGDTRTRGNPRFKGGNPAHNTAPGDALAAVAAERGATAAQLDVVYALSRRPDMIPLIGARKLVQLGESLAALDPHLTVDDLARVEAAIPAGAAAGGRYPSALVAHLGSERPHAAWRPCIAWGARQRRNPGAHPGRCRRAAAPARSREDGGVDMGGDLGMSHADVYRHFPSKAALRCRGGAVAAGRFPPADRYCGGGSAPALPWALIQAKRRKVLDDPGLFATYSEAAANARAVVEAHVADMRAQLVRNIRAGVDDGSFGPRDPRQAAGAVLNATSPSHHPLLPRDPLRRGAGRRSGRGDQPAAGRPARPGIAAARHSA